jgi:DNA-nicking Smr family endonuclease
VADSGKPKKKDEAFNNPFKGLKLQKEAPPPPAAAGKPGAAGKAPAKAPPKAPPPRPAAPPPPLRKTQEEADQELFLQALDGVRPLSRRPPVTTPRGKLEEPELKLPDRTGEDAEALAQLAEMVSGQGDFDLTEEGALLEGSAKGLDARLLRSLRRGDFPMEGQLDLHGKSQADARDALERYLSEARRAGRRCVLVVHGKGLNSPDNVSVLKEQMSWWLTQGRLGRMVLAFTTARPQDGGAGALYVLLRR